MRFARQVLLLLTAAALGAGGVLWAFRHGPLRSADSRILSSALRLLPPAPYEDSPLVYVKIQDVRDLPWPWPPLDYAILTHCILPFFPKTVAWEVLPPDPSSAEDQVYHKQWARQLERLNQVILPATLYNDPDRGPESPPVRPLAVVGDLSRLPSWTHAGAAPPAGTAVHGAINLAAADNRSLDRVPLLFRCGDTILPSLALQAFAHFRDADWASSGAVLGHQIRLRNAAGDLVAGIPIDDSGCLRLPPLPTQTPWREVEFYSVILASENRREGGVPDLGMGMFRNALVLIGRNHEDIAEPIPSATGPRFAAQIHLHTLYTLLSNHGISDPDPALFWGLGALLTLMGLMLGLIDHPLWWLGGSLFLLTDLLATAAWLLTRQALWISPPALIAAGLTGFLLARLLLPRLHLPVRTNRKGELIYEQKGFPL